MGGVLASVQPNPFFEAHPHFHHLRRPSPEANRNGKRER